MQNPSEALPASVNLVFLPWNPVAARKVRRLVDEFGPDLAHFHNTWYSLSPAVLQQSVPTVITFHNYRFTCATGQLFRDGQVCHACLDGSAFNAVRYGCYHGRLASVPAATSVALHRTLDTWNSRVDQILVGTKFAHGMLLQAGIEPEQISIKRNFVLDPGVGPVRPSASDYIVFAGRLDRAKGIQVLLRAWEKLNPPLRLLVVGDGDLRKLVQDQPKVEFLGWRSRNEILSIVGEARALVAPSLSYETGALVTIEAMALGRALIGSGLGAIGETVSPLGVESTVLPGDVDDLCRAIEVLLGDSAVDRRGAAARDLYEQRHTPEMAMEEMLAAYDRARLRFQRRGVS